MNKSLLVFLVLCLNVASFGADEPSRTSKAALRAQAAADVLDEIQGAPDKGIPQEVLGSAECVAVVPSMLKGGFIVGGRYGRGLASCRTPKGWSAPAFFAVKGGSVGFQIGDWKMRAQVLTYSRARGIFAGVSLAGAVINQDKDSTRDFYGRMVPFKTSLTGEVDPPAGANAFLNALAKWAQEASK
jgi:lipid-binding SYLF domain-containing protein